MFLYTIINCTTPTLLTVECLKRVLLLTERKNNTTRKSCFVAQCCSRAFYLIACNEAICQRLTGRSGGGSGLHDNQLSVISQSSQGDVFLGQSERLRRRSRVAFFVCFCEVLCPHSCRDVCPWWLLKGILNLIVCCKAACGAADCIYSLSQR